jgi:hypothetical protein
VMPLKPSTPRGAGAGMIRIAWRLGHDVIWTTGLG